MDRLRALQIFIAVAEAKSLAGAARNLSVSAPTVTRVLGEFEEELGVLLFHRTTRAVSLSEPGAQFLQDAKRIMGDYEESTDAVRGALRQPTGRLRVTAPVLFGQHYVLPVISEFLTQHEQMTVEAIFLDRVVNIVEEGFDVAVRIGPLADSSMRATRVGWVRRMVCGSDAYFKEFGVPKSPSDLANHRTISAATSADIQEWKFRDTSVKLVPRLHLNSVPARIKAARAGWGLCRILSYQIAPDVQEPGAELRVVLGDFESEPMPIHLVHAEGRSASAKVRAFLDLATNSIRSIKHLNPGS